MDANRCIRGGRRGVLVATLLLGVAANGGAGDGADTRGRLDVIRDRLRQEAGSCEVPSRGEDIPLVAVTVLPGDTHEKIAEDLTGFRDAAPLLRRIEPQLQPGRQIYVPRALLHPRLSDPRVEALVVGELYPTLWSLAREGTITRGSGTAKVVRDLQRLNAIADPSRIHRGARVLVPRSLLLEPPALPADTPKVSRRYRVTNLRGLERKPTAAEFPSTLLRSLRKQGLWERQLQPRPLDLVVMHTTEHRGAPLDNVASYLQRKRLANYLVGPGGEIYALVPESHRAFGSGQSLWEGRYAVDHEAINIEIYADTAPGEHRSGIGDAQYAGVRDLIRWIRSRYPAIHEGRVVTHRMVAASYTFGTRSRKGDPYEFDWTKAGLPDNSLAIDQDVLVGRTRLCTDERYTDRVTAGQSAAARYERAL